MGPSSEKERKEIAAAGLSLLLEKERGMIVSMKVGDKCVLDKASAIRTYAWVKELFEKSDFIAEDDFDGASFEYIGKGEGVVTTSKAAPLFGEGGQAETMVCVPVRVLLGESDVFEEIG
jgi:hypothetical protein